MQKSSITHLGTLVCFVAGTIPCYSALTIGDLAVVGLNSDTSDHVDQFAIVALANIPANELIKLTDRGWQSGFYDNNLTEGTLVWQPTAEVAAGSVFRVSVNLGSGTASGLPGNLSIQDGFTSGAAGIFTGGGDQVLIYQGLESSPTFIYGFSSQATDSLGTTVTGEWQANGGNLTATTSALPPLLTNGFSAVAFTVDAHADNMVYTGLKEGDKDTLLAAISNRSNWSTSDTEIFDLSPGGTQFPTSFNVVPEPSSALLLILGSAGLMTFRKRG